MKFKIKKKVILPVLICALALGTTACSDDTTDSNAVSTSSLIDYKTADGTISLQYPETWTMTDSTQPGGPTAIYLIDASGRNIVNIDGIPNVTPEAMAQVDAAIAKQRTNAEASDTFAVVGEETRNINGLEFNNLSLEINNAGLYTYFSIMYYYDEANSIVYLMTTNSMEFNTSTVNTSSTTDTTTTEDASATGDTTTTEDDTSASETSTPTTTTPVELTTEEKQANVEARNDMEIIVTSFTIN